MPSLTTSSSNPAHFDVEILVVGLASTPEGALVFAHGFAPEDEAALQAAARSVGAGGERAGSWRVPAPEGFHAASVVFTGVGPDTPGEQEIRDAAGWAALGLTKVKSVGYALASATPAEVFAVAEGALLGAHRVRKTHAEAVGVVSTLLIHGELSPALCERAQIIAQAVWRVRDLVSLPPNILTPSSFVELVSEMAAPGTLAIEVLDEIQLKDQGYGGLTAVGQGSQNPPRLMVLRHTPPGARRHIALVGKGITFDTGGLSLKPPNSMVGMKYDMTGAAVVSAVALAAATLESDTAVTAWVCLAENMPSGSASRPNDVITIKNGTTVEILNTDAEGRLVLADGLSAASAENPDMMIDVATLTGAARVALGERYAGLMGSPQAISQVEDAAAIAGELVWAMPLPEELRALLNTDVADIANAKPGNSLGGMLLAGLFLKEFVGTTPTGDPLAWAHLDIAGPAENSSGAWGYTPKGPTGALVRTLITLVSSAGEKTR